MSLLSGKLIKTPNITGDIKDKTPSFVVITEQHNNVPTAKLSRIVGITGRISRFGRAFFVKTRLLDVIYRFIASYNTIRQIYCAKGNTAPATSVETDVDIHTSNEATLSPQPVTDLTVDHAEKFSLLAKLVAYRRAALSYIKKIFMGRTAEMSTAPGSVARFIRVLPFVRKSGAVAANSAIAESRYNTAPVVVTADALSVPTEIMVAAKTIPEEFNANASCADVVDVNAQTVQKTVVQAGLFAWFLPEYADGALTIFQAFSGVQSADTVEVDTEEESVYWANAINRGGVLSLVFAQTDPQTDNELKVI